MSMEVLFWFLPVLLMINWLPPFWKTAIREHFVSSFVILQCIKVGISSVIAFLAYYFFMPDITWWTVCFFWSIIGVVMFVVDIFYFNDKLEEYQVIPIVKAAGCAVLWIVLIASLCFAPIIHTTDSYTESAKYVTEDNVVPIFSTDTLNVVTEHTARRDAKTSLSEFNDASLYKIGDEYKSEYNGKSVWINPVAYSNNWMALVSGKPLAGYTVIDATGKTETYTVNNLYMQYAPSGVFDKYLKRLVYNHDSGHILFKESFELDDNGNPFWIIPFGHYNWMRYFKIVDGVHVVNPETGEITTYNVNNVPEWIDTVYPEIVADEYCNAYGGNFDGFWSREFVPTTQWKLTVLVSNTYKESSSSSKSERSEYEYLDDDVWSIIVSDNDKLYCSDTSHLKNTERTMIGYVTMSAKTGKITYNPYAKGINGNAIAQNMIQNYKEKRGWVVSEPTIYSINNVPFWFAVIIDENGNIQNYNIGNLAGEVWSANTVKDVLAMYMTGKSYESIPTASTQIQEIIDTMALVIVGDYTAKVENGKTVIRFDSRDFVSLKSN